MDFLDPKRQRQHKIILITGYILIAAAVVGLTTVLVYEAYGFGLGKGGTVIQNGLIYISSQPKPANITLNSKLQSSTTNTSLTLPEGIYNFKLSRSGYRTWSLNIEINGGTIEDYTYPILIPTKLEPADVKSYSSAPLIATQSPSNKWLLILEPGSDTTFDLYNLSNPALAPTQITIPANIVSLPQTSAPESWQVVAWANDNQHVLLNHLYDGKNEYILVDIANPSQSINLSQTLSGVSFTSITLNNDSYNSYYLYNAANDTLMSDTLSSPTNPKTVLTNVLNYDTYGGNTILYATPTGAADGKVDIDELVGTTNYHLKTLPAGTTYLLNMAGYSGSTYVVAGAASQNQVFIYDNPVGQLQADPKQAPVPVQVLSVNNPNYVSFSDNTQFIMAESGDQFAVYNLENSAGYKYTTSLPLDAPQTNATWMDGDRMTYVSGGKLVMFEYDDNYQQTLVLADASYPPFFTPSYNYFYTLVPGPNNSTILTRTSLYTPADQPQKI